MIATCKKAHILGDFFPELNNKFRKFW